MLTLKVNELEKLFESVNEFDMGVGIDTFPSQIIDNFKNCFIGDSKIFENLMEGLYCMGNSKLDYRNISLESIIQDNYEKITESNNILLTPVNLIMHKYQNRDNYFLPFQQKNKSRIINGEINISEDEVLESMILLDSMNLIPSYTLEKSVSSISIETMLSANALMINLAENDTECNPMDENVSNNRGCQKIEFGTTLRVESLFDEVMRTGKILYPTEIISALDRDFVNIVELNHDIEYEINGCVFRYLKLHTDMVDEDKDTLKILVKQTEKIYKKYCHRLTALILKWIILMAKSNAVDVDLNADLVERLQNSSTLDNRGISAIWKIYFESICNLQLNSPLVRKCNQKDCNMITEEGITNTGVYYGSCIKSYAEERHWSQAIKALTESFKVLKDGTIRVVLERKTTYMDEYAMNHRLLKLNDETGDIEGMKYNLVYHLLLVESIEKNVIHNDKVDKNSAAYKDAEKARGFALNDIATYLPKVKKEDPKFDLNKFYKRVKADKCTVEINVPSTISGVKRIVQSIIL